MRSLVRLFAARILGRPVGVAAATAQLQQQEGEEQQGEGAVQAGGQVVSSGELDELQSRREQRDADQETSDNVIAAYAAILIGCLCRDHPVRALRHSICE